MPSCWCKTLPAKRTVVTTLPTADTAEVTVEVAVGVAAEVAVAFAGQKNHPSAKGRVWRGLG